MVNIKSKAKDEHDALVTEIASLYGLIRREISTNFLDGNSEYGAYASKILMTYGGKDILLTSDEASILVNSQLIKKHSKDETKKIKIDATDPLDKDRVKQKMRNREENTLPKDVSLINKELNGLLLIYQEMKPKNMVMDVNLYKAKIKKLTDKYKESKEKLENGRSLSELYSALERRVEKLENIVNSEE